MSSFLDRVVVGLAIVLSAAASSALSLDYQFDPTNSPDGAPHFTVTARASFRRGRRLVADGVGAHARRLGHDARRLRQQRPPHRRAARHRLHLARGPAKHDRGMGPRLQRDRSVCGHAHRVRGRHPGEHARSLSRRVVPESLHVRAADALRIRRDDGNDGPVRRIGARATSSPTPASSRRRDPSWTSR
jgi:hypothetical protein